MRVWTFYDGFTWDEKMRYLGDLIRHLSWVLGGDDVGFLRDYEADIIADSRSLVDLSRSTRCFEDLLSQHIDLQCWKIRRQHPEIARSGCKCGYQQPICDCN